jgi:hypothetical protein
VREKRRIEERKEREMMKERDERRKVEMMRER